MKRVDEAIFQAKQRCKYVEQIISPKLSKSFEDFIGEKDKIADIHGKQEAHNRDVNVEEMLIKMLCDAGHRSHFIPLSMPVNTIVPFHPSALVAFRTTPRKLYNNRYKE